MKFKYHLWLIDEIEFFKNDIWIHEIQSYSIWNTNFIEFTKNSYNRSPSKSWICTTSGVKLCNFSQICANSHKWPILGSKKRLGQNSGNCPFFFIINFPDLDFYNHYKIQSKIWHFLAKYFIRNQNSLFILKIINKMDFSHFAENRKWSWNAFFDRRVWENFWIRWMKWMYLKNLA